jgi:ubiquinone/menaquinone biosynthesis C-methylase UbiE
MDQIVDYYDKLAEKYDSDRFENSYGKFIDFQERRILDRLLADKKELILDLACGSGRFMNYASIGVDASQEMLKIASEKYPEKSYYQSDAELIPLQDNSIDSIITFHFFMHLDKEKVQKILKECHRVLKPNGRIIFDIPSAKRRSFIGYKKSGWHGNFALTNKQINELSAEFCISRSFGILFIPIHRIPVRLRNIFIGLDRILSNSFLKEYSSYQIIELIKK